MDMAGGVLAAIRHIPRHRKFWAEAVNFSNYLRNGLYTSACNYADKTPFEVVMGKKPDLSHIHKFGAKAYVHIPKQKRNGKFDERAEVGYCVGIAAGKGYRVFLPHANKVGRTKSVGQLVLRCTNESNVDGYSRFIISCSPLRAMFYSKCDSSCVGERTVV